MITLNLGDQEAKKIYNKLFYKKNPVWVGLRDKLADQLHLDYFKLDEPVAFAQQTAGELVFYNKKNKRIGIWTGSKFKKVK